MLLPPQNGRCGRQGAVVVLCGPRADVSRLCFGRCCGRVVALGQDFFAVVLHMTRVDSPGPPVENS